MKKGSVQQGIEGSRSNQGMSEKCQLSWKENERKGKDRENAIFAGAAGSQAGKSV
jgi:hypothetical protein